MLPPFQQPSQLKLCGNHFKTRSSGNCVCGHVHLQGHGVEEVWVCTISPCNCCEILLSRGIYYYVKLKSAWFPAVSACAEGLVSIVTNIKALAGTSIWSSIWACFAAQCNPVRVVDGWQAVSFVAAITTGVMLCTLVCTLRAKNRHFAKWSWRWGGGICFSLTPLPSPGRAAKWKHWRMHQSMSSCPGVTSAHQSERYAWELGPFSPQEQQPLVLPLFCFEAELVFVLLSMINSIVNVFSSSEPASALT